MLSGVPAPMYIPCNTDADAFRWNHSFDREPFRLGGNSGPTICGDVDNVGGLCGGNNLFQRSRRAPVADVLENARSEQDGFL